MIRLVGFPPALIIVLVAPAVLRSRGGWGAVCLRLGLILVVCPAVALLPILATVALTLGIVLLLTVVAVAITILGMVVVLAIGGLRGRRRWGWSTEVRQRNVA